MQLNNKKNRFEELDSLRGIAALFVVFFHLTMGRPEHNAIFKLGVTGVDLFFMISGFVIFMSINKISKGKEFVINRVSRLYPTYWASVTFTFLLIILVSLVNDNSLDASTFLNYAGNMTMFQFYLHMPDLDGSYWTMIIEMLFYISILFLYRFKLLKYLDVIGVFLCIVTACLIHYFFDLIIVRRLIFWFPLLQFIPLFFAGTIFYKIYNERTKGQFINYALITLCLVCQLTVFEYVGRSRGFISWNEYSIMLILYFVVFILFVSHSLKFIVNKATLFFGKISFALYLIHQFLLSNVILPFLTDKLKINFWVGSFFIAIPLVIGIATFITIYIEAPLQRKMKEMLYSKFED